MLALGARGREFDSPKSPEGVGGGGGGGGVWVWGFRPLRRDFWWVAVTVVGVCVCVCVCMSL